MVIDLGFGLLGIFLAACFLLGTYGLAEIGWIGIGEILGGALTGILLFLGGIYLLRDAAIRFSRWNSDPGNRRQYTIFQGMLFVLVVAVFCAATRWMILRY